VSFQFKGKIPWPQLRFTVVFLLITIIFVSLGIWQLQRAEEKRAIEAVLRERDSSPPLQLGAMGLKLSDAEDRRAIAKGQFDNIHTVFLDNQIHQGQVGYHVLTPMRLAEGEGAILVNRGWVPMGADRQQLPEVETPHSIVMVRGRLRSPPRAPFFLGDQENWQSTGWPKLVQYVDVERLQAQLGYFLYPWVLQLAPDEPYGFIRQWATLPTSAHHHIAYAIQWFAMALVAIVVFVVLYRRRFNSNKECSKK